MHYLFNFIEYLASLRTSRYGDPLTAEWKFQQVRAWVCVPVTLVAFGLCASAAHFLDIMDGNALLRPMSEVWRPTVAYLALGALSPCLPVRRVLLVVGLSLRQEALG